jgi:glycosyltransferase involved in cell wall biosynthesis
MAKTLMVLPIGGRLNHRHTGRFFFAPGRRAPGGSAALRPGGPAPRLARLKISLVIPAYNEERLLAATLGRINAARAVFGAAGWDSEVILCDNNSTDRTAEIARAAGARVVFEPVNQIARARNRGAAATGDWLLFVDADSQPAPELFADVVRAIRGGRCLAGGSTVRIEAGPLARLLAGAWNLLSRMRGWMAGSFIFCETAAFRRIGGFSAELFACEEIDLSQRLRPLAREQGRRIEILHRHPLRTSPRKVHLYSAREHGWFLLRLALGPRRILRSREACHLWYDGRR